MNILNTIQNKTLNFTKIRSLRNYSNLSNIISKINNYQLINNSNTYFYSKNFNILPLQNEASYLQQSKKNGKNRSVTTKQSCTIIKSKFNKEIYSFLKVLEKEGLVFDIQINTKFTLRVKDTSGANRKIQSQRSHGCSKDRIITFKVAAGKDIVCRQTDSNGIASPSITLNQDGFKKHNTAFLKDKIKQELKYSGAIYKIKQISKPGRRVYLSYEQISNLSHIFTFTRIENTSTNMAKQSWHNISSTKQVEQSKLPIIHNNKQNRKVWQSQNLKITKNKAQYGSQSSRLSIYILRTSKGMITEQEAIKLQIGGELISKIEFNTTTKSW